MWILSWALVAQMHMIFWVELLEKNDTFVFKSSRWHSLTLPCCIYFVNILRMLCLSLEVKCHISVLHVSDFTIKFGHPFTVLKWVSEICGGSDFLKLFLLNQECCFGIKNLFFKGLPAKRQQLVIVLTQVKMTYTSDKTLKRLSRLSQVLSVWI